MATKKKRPKANTRKRATHAKHRRRTLVKNPKQLLFRTKAAARKYAKAHGAKRYSIKKLKAGR